MTSRPIPLVALVMLVHFGALGAVGALVACPAQTCDSRVASCDEQTCAPGELCITCGCSRPICVAKSDLPVLQRPLYRCSDGGPLATQCKATQQPPDCANWAGYLCDGKCIAMCLPDPPPPVVPPPLPPIKVPVCLDGSYAKPCASDTSARDIYNSICPQDFCGRNPSTKCVPFMCGDGKCFPNCVESDVVVNPPGQQLPLCDGVPVKPGCPTATAVSQCAAIDCKQGTTCVEYWCSNTCQVTCVEESTPPPTDPPPTGPPEWPYLCLDPPDTPAYKCNLEGRFGCDFEACPPGQIRGAFSCSGNCQCTCVQDLYSSPGNCADSDLPAKYCKLKEDSPGCKVVRCAKGSYCAVASCNGVCAATCLKDPNYFPTGYKCLNDADAYSCNAVTDSVCTEQCDEDNGSFCMVVDCGDGSCKPQCVRDPNFKPYLCPRPTPRSVQSVAKKCDATSQGDKTSVTCSAYEEAQGPCYDTEGFFCGEMICDGVCSAQCLAWPWFELPGDWAGLCPGGSTPTVCTSRPPKGSRCSDNPSLCSKPGTKCAEVSCGGVCGPICVPDPNYTQSDFTCPADPITKAFYCTPRPGTRGCGDAPINWDDGETCQMLDCLDGQGCRGVILPDPCFKPYMCPSDAAGAAVAGKKCDVLAEGGRAEQTCADLACTAEGTFCAELRGCVPGDAQKCSAVCTKDPWYTLPDFYTGSCPDGSTPTICEGQAAADKKCSVRSELANEDEGVMCTEVACNGVCQAISVKNPYIQPSPWKCPDGKKAQMCAFMTNVVMGKAECAEPCTDGEFCELFLCDDVCSARCMPLPPPTDWRFYDKNVPSPPPGSTCGKKKASAGCAAVMCAIGTTCVINTDECGSHQPVCLDPLNKQLNAPLETKKRSKTSNKQGDSSGGSNTGVTASNQLCAQGTPATCKTTDPCAAAGCNPKTQDCIVERCGGCTAQCVSKKEAVCDNGLPMRLCSGTANFCLNIKGCENGFCVPDPCNNCRAKCIKACPAKTTLNPLKAKCKACPAGFRCPSNGNRRNPFPEPKPCNAGKFQPKSGQKECLRCKKGETTRKSKKLGFAKCSKVK